MSINEPLTPIIYTVLLTGVVAYMRTGNFQPFNENFTTNTALAISIFTLLKGAIGHARNGLASSTEFSLSFFYIALCTLSFMRLRAVYLRLKVPKAYRPITLLCTLGKALESVIATQISFLVDEYRLLPETHIGGRDDPVASLLNIDVSGAFDNVSHKRLIHCLRMRKIPLDIVQWIASFRCHLGGRRGISTDHAIHIIIDRIKTSWGKGKPVVSLLMLDVGGAYDNVSHERLLHNLKERCLGHFVPWVKAFLTNRSTRIRMPEGMSDTFPTPTSIPQGSPISPILYLVYNADLLEGCGTGITSNGWVDDVGFMAKGDSERETTRKLRAACQKADRWAEKHASVFDPKKYALIHFVNTKEVDPQYTSLTLRGHTVTATRTAERYLGYWLGPGL
ncbi:zinc knuckle domain protein [Penicillium odoratum]|uniref:zinc knuckle domain protein n=1 Tax=Penicillium odoratum TaxID=1167516 RepID=UPI002549BC3E|nr:zinc knuckle domain protein [Penicillium odoratum]KAJ5751584.1 zinc knuckle domain protein [Penicillium odoratum]